MKHRLAASVLALLLAACGGPSAPGGASGPAGTGQDAARNDGGTGSAKVTYKPEAKIMSSEEGMKLIVGVSSNESAFLLDGTNPAAQTLAAGDTWMVKGQFARKIAAVEAQPDGDILVLTERAELTDIISDGEIAINQPVNFATAGEHAQLLDLFGNIIAPPAYAQNFGSERLGNAEKKGAADARGKMVSMLQDALIDGWKVTTNPSLAGGKFKIDMKLTREVANLKGVVTVDGYLDGFDFEGSIGVTQGTMDRITGGLKKINGLLNVTWEVASSDGPGDRTSEHKIKLPASVQIPLSALVDGLPLYLEISSAIIIKPALTGGQEYTKGAFRITYDGVQHFALNKGVIDSNGNVKGDISFTGGQNISALAPVGMVVALAAPRVELSFGFNKIFKFGDFKKAAKYVDLIASQAAKRLLPPDVYNAWQNSPFSSIKFGDAVGNAMKSDAAAYFEIVTTSGMTHSGMSVIAPCTRDELSISARVGANAEAFGQKLGETEKDIFHKEVVHLDPPTVKLCQLGDGGDVAPGSTLP